MTASTPALLTVRDAARMLAVSERHLHRLTKNGTAPHLRLGRLVRFDAAALSQWIDSQSRGGAV